MVLTPLFGQDGDPSQIKDSQDVWKVILKREGKGDNIESLKGGKGLEGHDPFPLLQPEGHLRTFREKNTLCDDLFSSIQEVINCLETQTGHADPIGVGIAERNGKLAAPLLSYRPFFL
jgi:hypothetical protein